MNIVVICTLIVYLASGGRDVIQAEGVVLNDDNTTWIVDFERTMKKYSSKDREFNTDVRKVKGNACLRKKIE